MSSLLASGTFRCPHQLRTSSLILVQPRFVSTRHVCRASPLLHHHCHQQQRYATGPLVSSKPKSLSSIVVQRSARRQQDHKSRTERLREHRKYINTTTNNNDANGSAPETSKMVEQLPSLDPITRLSPLVIRILGHNPSKFTLQGTNTYLVGTGRRRILIDTGEGRAEWKASLKKVLADEGAEIGSVLLTHWHGDHVGGIEDVKEIIMQSQADPDGENGEKVTFYKNRPSPGQTDIKNNQRFTTEGATLTSFYCPGHTNDHMAFVLEEESAMFTGDNVLGHGTAVFEDLAAYMRSLEAMQQSSFSGRAYPGHGMEIADGKAKIREYIAHRKEREEQAIEVLKRERPESQEGGGGGEGWRSMSMVKVIYSQYPEHLHGPAEGGLVQVLAKLEKDGKVVRCEDGTWKLADKAAL